MNDEEGEKDRNATTTHSKLSRRDPQSEAGGTLSSPSQIPDSDKDESMEELAEQEEQTYWNLLGNQQVELGNVIPRDLCAASVPHARYRRSKSPLVSSVQYSSYSLEAPVSTPGSPPLLPVQPTVLRNSSTTSRVCSQHPSCSSPDPLQLANNAHDIANEQIQGTRQYTNADEGYQTKTDSDHVINIDCTINSQSSPQPAVLSPAISNVVSPPAGPSVTSRLAPTAAGAIDYRFLSSPTPSDSASPSPDQSVLDNVQPIIRPSVSSASISENTHVFDMPGPSSSDKAHMQVMPARALRQRKAIQMAPYSTEFSKFASIASKNDWQGIISAGLRQAFLEKEGQKEDHSDRQRNPSDEWLVRSEEEEDERLSDQVNSSGDGSTVHCKFAGSPREHGKSIRRKPPPEKLSRSRKEKEWDPIAARLKAGTSTITERKQARVNDILPHASTSRTTLEDLERPNRKRPFAKKGPTKPYHHQAGPVRSSRTAVHDEGARSKAIRKAKEVGLLPSDVESSTEECKASSPRRRKRRSRNLPQAAKRLPGSHVTEQPPASASASVSTSSESDQTPGSDSPERPSIVGKDRFTLRGKRKRAAMFMMPAVAFKRAEADLRLMEQELAEGKNARLERAEGEEGSQRLLGHEESEASRATKRWIPRNANRPFRYVTEISTDDSDSASLNSRRSERAEDNETQAAMQQWSDLAGETRNRHTHIKDNDPKYWEGVISKILTHRDSPRRRKHTNHNIEGSKRAIVARDNERVADTSSLKRSRKRLVQSSLTQSQPQPVYLDRAELLLDTAPSDQVYRPRMSSVVSRATFFKQFTKSLPSNLPCGTSPDSPQEPPPQSMPEPELRTPRPINDSTYDFGERTKYARFSFDYNIDRLPVGLAFAQSTAIGMGYLSALVNCIRGKEAEVSLTRTTCFGMLLDTDMEASVLLQMLPRLLDCTYEYIVGEDRSVNLNCPVGAALRFVGRYFVDECKSSRHLDETLREQAFRQLAQLEDRIQNYVQEVDSLDDALTSSLISFKWAFLELSIKAYVTAKPHTSAAVKSTARHQILGDIDSLVALLVNTGSTLLASTIQQAADHNTLDGVDGCFEDIRCETWTCLLHVSFASEQSKDLEFMKLASFWHALHFSLNEEAIARKMHPIVKGELASCMIMALCALSQFSVQGIATVDARLPAHWPLVYLAVENVKPQDFGDAYDKMTSANRTRTSRYVWTVFARVLIMATRWRWSLLGQSKLIGKLFDILNSRQLEDFSIDAEPAFPAFLLSYSGNIPADIDSNDTCFHLLLRILAQLARQCHETEDPKVKGIVTRMAMRIMPMRERLPYPRKSFAGKSTHRSVLVNHCSLLIVLAAIDPDTADRRFSKLKTILNFEEADVRARQDYLRATMILGMVYRILKIDLKPVLAWLTVTANYLRNTYELCAKTRAGWMLAKQRTSITKATPQYPERLQRHPLATDIDKEIQATNKDMGETALLEALLLGAVQRIMTTGPTAVDCPCLEFLDKAWVAEVLSSPMARDPIAGSQVLQLLQKFLSLRTSVISVMAVEQSESQDEFGDMDFDYDDPALNVMLGLPNTAADAATTGNASADVNARDRAFVESLRSSLSPLLYSLISDLNASASGHISGVPQFANMTGYIENVVEVWAACAAILVSKNCRDWTFYTTIFGKESWQRVGNAITKYEVGTIFCSQMLKSDKKAYQCHRDILLEVLFRRLAAPHLTAHDAAFWTLVLNADPDLFSWQGFPFELDDVHHEYCLSQEDMSRAHMAVLRIIFSNFKKVLVKGSITIHGIPRSSFAVCREQKIDDQLIYRLLGNLLASLRDFLDDDISSAKNSNNAMHVDYAATCRKIVYMLREELGQGFATEQSIPQLRLLAGVLAGRN